MLRFSTARALSAPVLVLALLGADAESDDWEERLARSIPEPGDVVTVRSPYGVAATLNEEATRAAVDVLEEGGTAMDAAAAAWLVMTVVSPNQTGLGGGGFILYHDAATGQTHFVDANVAAGGAAHPEIFLDSDGEPLSNNEIRSQGMAVGVPGLVRGFDRALKRWGTRDLGELAGPAIRLAEEGWTVDRELSLRIHQTREALDERASALFVPEGEPLQPGDRLVQEEKARALQAIAEEGSQAFYQGEIAEAVVEHVRDLGGFLTVEDFRRYNARFTTPLHVPYGDHDVVTNPAAAGGATLALLLRILEPFDLDLMEPRSVERLHLLLEATRLAQAGATDHFADPAFVDWPWQALASEDFASARRKQIRPGERMDEVEAVDPWAFQPAGTSYHTRGHHRRLRSLLEREGNPTPPPEGEGTDHFTVADRDGNLVAVTSTLGVAWSAGHMVPDYGFMLNVTGGYFDREPGGAQEIRPGKRPRSNMTPTFVLRDGRPLLSVGSPSPAGMQHVQVLLNVVEHDLDLSHAVAEPRVAPDSIWEAGLPDSVLDGLRRLGQPMAPDWTDRGAVPVILRDGGEWVGASDPRRDGVAGAAGSPWSTGARLREPR